MERKTRVPTQKRALEKYNKILDAAFILFNEKGYYNTTTQDIAKRADVATGSVYAYFEDKKDIYIQTLETVSNKILNPSIEYWKDKKTIDKTNAKDLFYVFLNLTIDSHKFSKRYNDEMEALYLLDEDIRNKRNELYSLRNNRIMKLFEEMAIPFKSQEDSKAFLRFCNLILEDTCHRIIYDNEVFDKEIYINSAMDMIYALLISTTTYDF